MTLNANGKSSPAMEMFTPLALVKNNQLSSQKFKEVAAERSKAKPLTKNKDSDLVKKVEDLITSLEDQKKTAKAGTLKKVLARLTFWNEAVAQGLEGKTWKALASDEKDLIART